MKQKKPKPPTLEELKAERKTLLDNSNPKRLKEVNDKIDFIEWGIINK